MADTTGVWQEDVGECADGDGGRGADGVVQGKSFTAVPSLPATRVGNSAKGVCNSGSGKKK